MNNLLKSVATTTSSSSSRLCLTSHQLLFTRTPLLLHPVVPAAAAVAESSARSLYTFRFPNNRLHKYKRATRPKLSGDNSIKLTYEQTQFAEDLGVTKSWNTWNTSNLLESKSQAETTRDDILIRRFIGGTFHDLISSELIIKRKQNTVTISFLVCPPRNFYPQKTYFLVGYSEELLQYLLKCVVKIDIQNIYNKNDLVFRLW